MKKGLWLAAWAALSGCASYDFVLREISAKDVEIVDKEVRRAERVAEISIPRPEAPAMTVTVKERAIVQLMKVRRFTRVERVRRAHVRLHFGAHAILWTVGWIAGGPIVWYPIFNGSAGGEAEYHARTADLYHEDKSLHPWEIELEEFDRETPGVETPVREIGPPTVVEEGPAHDLDLTVRLRIKTLQGRIEGEVIRTLAARTDADGRATVDLEAIVREHILQRGLEPILVEVQGGGEREPIRAEAWLRDDELLAAYQGAAVDWKVGVDAGRGKGQLDLFLDKREYTPGETPVLELSLINRGDGPMYRLWARVTTDCAPDAVRPLFVGRAAPGQVVDRYLKLWPIAPEHVGKRFKVQVEFREHGGAAPAARTLEFSVKTR